ncbi:hypothetical protein ACSBR1_042170 [Camellia fascicularis]
MSIAFLSSLAHCREDAIVAHLEAASKIQLKSLAEEMQAVSKGLEKVEQELIASENDGAISAGFQKVRDILGTLGYLFYFIFFFRFMIFIDVHNSSFMTKLVYVC